MHTLNRIVPCIRVFGFPWEFPSVFPRNKRRHVSVLTTGLIQFESHLKAPRPTRSSISCLPGSVTVKSNKTLYTLGSIPDLYPGMSSPFNVSFHWNPNFFRNSCFPNDNRMFLSSAGSSAALPLGAYCSSVQHANHNSKRRLTFSILFLRFMQSST